MASQKLHINQTSCWLLSGQSFSEHGLQPVQGDVSSPLRLRSLLTTAALQVGRFPEAVHGTDFNPCNLMYIAWQLNAARRPTLFQAHIKGTVSCCLYLALNIACRGVAADMHNLLTGFTYLLQHTRAVAADMRSLLTG